MSFPQPREAKHSFLLRLLLPQTARRGNYYLKMCRVRLGYDLVTEP